MDRWWVHRRGPCCCLEQWRTQLPLQAADQVCAFCLVVWLLIIVMWSSFSCKLLCFRIHPARQNDCTILLWFLARLFLTAVCTLLFAYFFIPITCIIFSLWPVVGSSDNRGNFMLVSCHLKPSFTVSIHSLALKAICNVSKIENYFNGIFIGTAHFSLDHCFLILLWSPYGIGQTIIFSSCPLFFLLFFPRLISAAADWMSAILPHMVWL